MVSAVVERLRQAEEKRARQEREERARMVDEDEFSDFYKALFGRPSASGESSERGTEQPSPTKEKWEKEREEPARRAEAERLRQAEKAWQEHLRQAEEKRARQAEEERLRQEGVARTPVQALYYQAKEERARQVLRIEEGKNIGKIYEIRKEALSIGSSRESDIFLEDLAVSRLHASVINVGNGFLYAVKDEGSANGTKVNGQLMPKNQAYFLQDGDRIQLGQTVLVFGTR